MHVGHDAADHQPGAEANQADQQHAENDAQAGGGGVVLAGAGQGLLEVLIGLGAERVTDALGLPARSLPMRSRLSRRSSKEALPSTSLAEALKSLSE